MIVVSKDERERKPVNNKKKKKNKEIRGKSVDLTNGQQYNQIPGDDKAPGKKHTTEQFARVQLRPCPSVSASARTPFRNPFSKRISQKLQAT